MIIQIPCGFLLNLQQIIKTLSSIMIWRWDQGRSRYFDVTTIMSMAEVIANFDGQNIKDHDPAFRAELLANTGQPFAPANYTIKRNYKRVFECALLATCNGNILVASDICKALAREDTFFNTSEDYLVEVERRFRYPFPAFNNYDDFGDRCYPFLAIIKLLIARGIRHIGHQPVVSLDDVGSYLIANEVSGEEPLDYYMQLQPRPFTFEDEGGPDHIRQVREMMTFIGQHTYLTVHNSSLVMASMTEDQYHSLFESLQPFDSTEPINNEFEDFLQITKLSDPTAIVPIEDVPSLEDFQIVEGRRVFQSHFARERSSQLRRMFIERNPVPICDICGKNMKDVYPWTKFMLEIHHITPLSSLFEEEHGMTTSQDVVGLCPSCHRAIHVYYRQYLSSNSKSDFDSKDEAHQVYNEAKEAIG